MSQIFFRGNRGQHEQQFQPVCMDQRLTWYTSARRRPRRMSESGINLSLPAYRNSLKQNQLEYKPEDTYVLQRMHRQATRTILLSLLIRLSLSTLQTPFNFHNSSWSWQVPNPAGRGDQIGEPTAKKIICALIERQTRFSRYCTWVLSGFNPGSVRRSQLTSANDSKERLATTQ